MPSRHKVVKLRSKNRHTLAMPAQEEAPVGSYTLDLVNECLYHGEQAIPLIPKVFAVLRYLVNHPDRLVSKQELLDVVWPDIAVSEAVLKNCILRLRQALGDQAKAPRFIETVHRRGYRLLTPIPTTPRPVQDSKLSICTAQSAIPLVGREVERQLLHSWLDKAQRGERQIAFIGGEPGIGKTTLVDAFLAGAASSSKFQVSRALPSTSQSLIPNPVPWIGRGQCIEHYGPGEAYLPVLEALDRLCQQPGQERLLPLLRQHAPMWLAQLPTLLTPDERTSLQREIAGSTRERMLRELAVLLEALTADTTLVLLLEDLHWSDPSTLDLLTLLARRREPARLLVVGTYRSSEVHTQNHPLSAVLQELQAHALCRELTIEGLSEAAVAQYVEQRFPVQAFPTRFVHVLHQCTEGNPLFLVNLIEDLIQQGVLTDGAGGWSFQGTLDALAHHVPSSSRQLITKLIGQVQPAIHQTLAAASVTGFLFSAAAVAAALDTTASEVERQCEEAVRRQLFIERVGKVEWPDGTEAARYGFRHALYQQMWHEQVSVSHQQQWHLRIGERKEGAYGQRAQEIAAELAIHFEQGRDYRRAVQYLQQAAMNALQRFANAESISHLTKGLELLTTLAETPERDQQELTLQLALTDVLFTLKGYAAPEVGKSLLRTQALCQRLGEAPQLSPVLIRLWQFHFIRAELQTAGELAEQLMRLTQSGQAPYLLSLAHMLLGLTLLVRGELPSARSHMEQAIALYDPHKDRHNIYNVPDPRVECFAYLAWILWLLGYPDQARRKSHESLALAEGLAHPFSLTYALAFAAKFHLLHREEQLAQAQAEAVLTLAIEHGFAHFGAYGTIVRGSVLATQGQAEEGIVQIQRGLAAYQTMGAEAERLGFLGSLIAAYAQGGRAEEGLAVVAEALLLVDKTGMRWFEAELYLLKGWLLLGRFGENPPEVEGCFRQAIEIARRQEAKSLELRAAMSLARLWQQQDKKREAHQLLSEIYGWFTEGFDTKDLQETKALLEELH